MNSSTGMRLSALAIVALSLIGALTARLWFLTAVEGEASVEAAEANRVRVIHIQAPRGRIFDRNQQVLVDNRQVRQVTVDTAELDEAVEYDEDRREAVYGRLAELLALYEVPPDQDVLDRAARIAREEDDDVLAREAATGRWTAGIVGAALVENAIGAFIATPIASEVPEELEILLAENHLEYPGVDVDRVAVRSYPHGSVAAHVLGYVGPVSGQEEVDEIQLADKPYELTDDVGRGGVEATYEQWLRGTPGTRVLEIDASNSVVRELDYEPPVPGMDLVLSLDLQVQVLLEQQLTAAAENNSAPGASGVVQDPRDGSILAMASYPTYQPADLADGLSQEEFEELQDPEQGQALLNRAIAGVYAPGSTFKPITAVAGLRSGFITPETSTNDTGVYYIQGCEEESCRFQNAGEQAYGTVNLQRSLTVSSDFYYYWVGDNVWAQRDALGDDFLQETAVDFGFTAETGIDLASEQDGHAFTPALVQELHEENPEAFPNPDWRAGNTVNMSIGQGDLGVTPLQLTNAYAAIANGGTLYRPHIGAETWEPDPAGDAWTKDGETSCADEAGAICTVTPSQVGTVEIPGQWRDPMVAGLVGVTASGEGTAAAAFEGFDLGAFPIAGKTGTAQVSGKEDFALFTAFGPVLPGQVPQYVVTVVLEEVGFGGEVAAPVVRAVFDGLSGQQPLPAVDAQMATPIPTGSSTDLPTEDTEDTEETDG